MLDNTEIVENLFTIEMEIQQRSQTHTIVILLFKTHLTTKGFQKIDKLDKKSSTFIGPPANIIGDPRHLKGH